MNGYGPPYKKSASLGLWRDRPRLTNPSSSRDFKGQFIYLDSEDFAR
jgi:hypothetical protein